MLIAGHCPLRQRTFIKILCLLVFVLALHTRLAAFEPQKASIKTFTDSEVWRKGQNAEIPAFSQSPVLYATPAFLVPLPDFYPRISVK